VTKRIRERLGRAPAVEDILAECARIGAHPSVLGHDLLRVYFYDAPPADRVLVNPLDGSKVHLGESSTCASARALHDRLELCPDFALRMGEVVVHGWQVGARATESLTKAPRSLRPGDLVPAIQQKGVDLRIGLDIARLALRRHVDLIVVVTGDSDLVPAFKFARREGLRNYLDHLGGPVRRSLKARSDRIL
jgi:uncharacterized LabA/DUF88 family protein